jgi:UDP-GlcNAc:undecaprenyl-phosphate/decaprenyl-phosphate GlcNAc-1-phosphate transferase
MKSLVLVHSLAVFIAALSCKVVRALAVRRGLVSAPGGRNVHTSATPRLGGVAMLLGIVVPLLVLLQIDSAMGRVLRAQAPQLLGMLGGAALIFVVGFVDDLIGLRALHKLIAQIVVAAATYALGFRIGALDLPVFGAVATGALGAPITILWIVGIINAINLIDGLDGLAGGIVLLAGLTNIVVALLTHSYLTAIVMTAMVGAIVGFLYHNFNPARIFMGDGGSYLLGYLFSVSVLSGSSTQKASAAVSLVVPFIALGVPIFDTLFSILRRAIERRPVFSADRGHIHHRLLDMGLTHRRAVLTLYGISVLFCVTAITVSLGRTWQVGIALVLAGLGGGGMLRLSGLFVKGRSPAPESALAVYPDGVPSRPPQTEHP